MSLAFCSIKLSLGVLKPWAKYKNALTIICIYAWQLASNITIIKLETVFPLNIQFSLSFFLKKASFHYILESKFSLQRNPSPI